MSQMDTEGCFSIDQRDEIDAEVVMTREGLVVQASTAPALEILTSAGHAPR